MSYIYNPDAILADPEAHPIHKDYARINIGIRDRGERWAKCPNCGSPYQITEEWTDGTFCSAACGDAFDDYLGGDLR